MAGQPMGERVAYWLAARIHRHALGIVVVALLLAVLSGALASGLRIDQELRHLLPSTFPSVVRLDAMGARLGSRNELYVTIRSPSRAANVAFGERVAAALAEREDLGLVQFRRDTSFFDRHALLYASLGDLLDLRRRVIARLREEVARKAYGTFGGADDEASEDAASSLGLEPEALTEEYGLEAGTGYGEYLEADDGRIMVVRARPSRPSTDLEYAEGLASEIDALVEGLQPETFHPEMQVGLDGSYVQHTERVRGLHREVFGGSTAAAVALLLTLAVYFRSPRALILVFVPLLASVLGALAYAYLVYGALNLVSAFIFAVLLGLGIDFGIHLLSRFRQERAAGADSQAALARTLTTSGWTTAAGGLSTSLAFAALTVADFRGFAQFGSISAIGVLLALTSALVVMPALAVLTDRVRPWGADPPPPQPGSARLRGWLRALALVVTVAGLGGAVWAAANLEDLAFEHDLRTLGSSRERGKNDRALDYRDAVGRGRSVDPIVALVEDPREAAALQRQFEALLAMTPEEAARFDPAHPPTRALPDTTAAEPDPLADEGDDFDDDLEDFGDDDLDDPRFVALERQAVEEAVMSPETARQLGRYGAARLAIMRDLLRQAYSLHAFVPRLQEEKLAVIRDIRRRIAAKRGGLGDEAEQELAQWESYLEVDAPFGPAALPAWVRAEFEEQDGTMGRYLVLATGGSKADIDRARAIYAAFGDLELGERRIPTAASFYVIPEIFDAIERDGPVVLAIALAVMLVTTFLVLRRVGTTLAVAATVGLALLWLAGTMMALDLKLNFFNVIVIPLLLGMGEDNALHLAERYHEEDGDLAVTLRDSGSPIVMTTLTTAWGFAGILFADHRGLRSMAEMAVAGMVFALVAAVAVLPFGLVALRRLRGGSP